MKNKVGMTILDLLTARANNEEIPECFEYDGYTFVLNEFGMYEDNDGDSITSHICKDLSNLKEIITIIEKPKKIEKLNAKYTSQIGKLELANKIDEIIEKINEMEK